MNSIDQSTWIRRGVWALALLVTVLVPGPGVFIALAIALGALYAFKDARRPTVAFVTRSWVFCMLIGITAGVGIHVVFAWLIEPLIEALTDSTIDLTTYAEVEGDLVAFLMLLAVGIVVGGIGEEFIYRGFVIGWGTRLFGGRSGPLLALLSGAVFGIAHWYQGVAGVVSTGLIGVSFGFLYLALDKKLLPVMVAHTVVNILGITSIYLGVGL